MRDIWPMGCKKTPTSEKVEELLANGDYIAQPKIDGVRCILHFDVHGIPHFTTRGASLDNPQVPLDITHRLEHMNVQFARLANFELDGEIYHPKYTSAEIAGMINYKSTVVVDPVLQLHVFDVLSVKGQNIEESPLVYRLEVLDRLKWVTKYLPFIVFVETVHSEEEKRQLLCRELEAGREGIVLKNLDSDYRFGTYKLDSKPVNHWYKVKKKDTVDVRITGSVPPEQYYRNPITGVYDETRLTKPWEMGWFGSIAFSFEGGRGDWGVFHTGSTSGITDEMRALLSDGHHRIKKEYIGRTMELEYMEKTSDGNLRHPRFVRIREEIEK